MDTTNCLYPELEHYRSLAYRQSANVNSYFYSLRKKWDDDTRSILVNTERLRYTYVYLNVAIGCVSNVISGLRDYESTKEARHFYKEALQAMRSLEMDFDNLLDLSIGYAQIGISNPRIIGLCEKSDNVLHKVMRADTFMVKEQ